MKTHFASVDRANESDNNDYWGATACGLQETESPLTDKWDEVSCKKCLAAKKKYQEEIKRMIESF